MKKIFVILVAASFTLSSYAAPVPSTITEAFKIEFSEAKDVKWHEYEEFIVASFTLEGKEKNAYYNYDGQLVVVAEVIAKRQLPKNLLNELDKYNNSSSVVYKMENEAETSYFAVLKNDAGITILRSFGKKWTVAQ